MTDISFSFFDDEGQSREILRSIDDSNGERWHSRLVPLLVSRYSQ